MTLLVMLFFLLTFLPIGIVFFNMRFQQNKLTPVVFFLSVLLCTFVEKYANPLSWYFFPLSFFLIGIMLYFVFRPHIRTLILFELISYFVISMLNELAMFICTLFLPNKFRANEFSELLQSIIVFILVCSFSFFLHTIHVTPQKLSIYYVLLFTVIIVIDTSIITVIGDFLFNQIEYLNNAKAIVAYSLLIIGILIQIILLIYMIKSRDLHKENERLAKQYLDNQARYYEYLGQRDNETKKFRHDIRSHLNMLNILFREDKIEDCKQYLSELTTNFEMIGNTITVNHYITDAILNKYLYEAKINNVALNVNGHFPPDCSLSAYDICTLFSNLLDNALKAVLECNGSNITVSCRYTDNEILISVENDSAYVKLDKNGLPHISTDKNSQHGFGLKNVQQCISKNNGHMTIDTHDNKFIVMLSLSRGTEDENCNNR